MSDTYRHIIRNAMVCPDGFILESKGQHDYQSHTDELTGDLYSTDGGCCYIRRSVNKVPATPLDVYSDDDFEVVRLWLLWGTYGKNGDEPFRQVCLSGMSTEHIKAVLATQCISPDRAALMKKELTHESRSTS